MEQNEIDAMFVWLESEKNPLASVALKFIKTIQEENSELEDYHIKEIELYQMKKRKGMDS